MKYLVIVFSLLITLNINAQNIEEINNLIAAERFDDAYNALIGLKDNSPQNPYVYFALCETVLKSYINDPYSETKSSIVKKATTFINEGIKSDSLNPLNYIGLGILSLFKNNDTLKAEFNFNKAMSLIPSKKKKINDLHITALLKLESSELYAVSPRFSRADYYFNKLIEIRPKLADIYINYGDVLLAQKKASEAIAQYKKALYLENTPLTNVMVAKIYFSARNIDEAQRYYETALKLDSLFAPAYKGLGEVFYKAKKNNLAKINYAKFLELTGNNIPAKINYIKALYKTGDYEGTIENAEDVLKVDSSKIYLYRLIAYSYFDKPEPDLLKALEYLQNFISKSTEEELIVKDYTYYSKILLDLKRDSNDIRNGVEMLEKAYLADTTDNSVLIDLIKASYYNKIYDIEIKYLSKKINKGDNTSGNYMLLGKALYYSKDFTKADSVFSIITKIDSLYVEAYQWKAYAQSSLDPELKEGLAKPSFEKILEVSTGEESKYLKERYDAYSYLASYYMFSAKIDYDKAIENIKKSIELDANNTLWQMKGNNTLAYAYYKSKQWQNAKNTYEKILKLNPDDANAPKALKDIIKYLSSQ